jgi:hypothetical protein
MDDSFALNQANWNERAALHAASPDYQVQLFIASPEHLSEVVRFDLPRLAACRTFLWFSAMIAACPQRDPA